MTQTIENAEFVIKYQYAIQLYEKAKKRLAEGEADDALAATRKSMESFVKEFCKKSGLETSDNDNGVIASNQNMIDSLKENGILDENEISILHRIRKLGNQGIHSVADMNAAQEAVDLMEKAIDIFASKDNDTVFARHRKENNIPVVNPRYYDTKRKYRGDWFFCYSREDLFSRADYVALSQKANQGDISAMLDLAIGFLPKVPLWGKEQIICMPKYKDTYYNEVLDAPDTRYYYWIVQACNRAVMDAANGKDYNKKYMATAFFEAIKFILHWELLMFGVYVSGVRGRDVIYSNPFELVRNIYGDAALREAFVGDWVVALLSLIKESGTCDIIDPLHQYNRSEESIRYLFYCYCYITGSKKTKEISVDFDQTAPYDGTVTLEWLERCKPAGGSCDMYYLGAKEYMKQKVAEEDTQKQAEGQARQQDEIKAETAQPMTRKPRGSFTGRMIRRLVLLVLLVIGARMAFPAQWNALTDKVPQVEKVDQWLDRIETPIRELWNILFPPVPSSKEVGQLLERSKQIGAVYSKDGTYAMMCYDTELDYSYDRVDWGRKDFPVIGWQSGLFEDTSDCMVLKEKYSSYLEEDAEHVARLDVSSYFKSWLRAGRNSTITDIRAVWVPEAAPENQRSFTHYNIHVKLRDNRTGEIFWACYILEAAAPSETWIPAVPNELLSLCSLKDLSVEEAASLLLGRDAVQAAEAYEKEMALRSDGSARAAEIEARLNIDDYTPYFTAGADTVLYGSYMNWKNKEYQKNDQWLHVFRYSNIHGVLGYVATCEIWAADEGTWQEEFRFTGGIVCDEDAQGLIGIGKGAKVTSARARFYERDSSEKPLDSDHPQCLINLHLEDNRTGREYIALVYLYLENTDLNLSEIINSINSPDFGGIYDISDLDTIEAAEYLNQVLD